MRAFTKERYAVLALGIHLFSYNKSSSLTSMKELAGGIDLLLGDQATGETDRV